MGEVAHKSKHRGQTSVPVPLPERIARARSEQRFQQALELSRQVYKGDPSEANLALLRQVSFERGRQLEVQKQFKDAITLYVNAADMGGPAEFQRQLIDRLAACGAVAEASRIAERVGDPQLLARVYVGQADAAMRHGPAAKSTLPAELRPQFDAVLQAFQHSEAGQDEEARAALQHIGLQSPFLEWRVFLRGLLAYYAKDDARAMENWQRLDPQRLPAKLAAPLRYGIDAAFRAAQPPTAQNYLRQLLDKAQSSGVVPGLRNLQAMLGRDGKLAAAFRQVEGLLPALRQEVPGLVPRLAACFRWAIIDNGQPEDIDRFQRVFGAPPDDPRLNRLAALALEHRGLFEQANSHWDAFEKDVAAHPAAWPGDQARHVRALVLAHMGNKAMKVAEDEIPDFLPFGPRRKKKAKPKQTQKQTLPEDYLRRSLELAPEVLATHEALFQYHQAEGQTQKAIAAGKRLLEHFPDHAATLKSLALLMLQEKQVDEAQSYFERALHVNPLDVELRLSLVGVHARKARALTLEKKFDEARARIQTILSLYDLPSRYVYRCLGAVIELKAKNQAGHDQLVAQAEPEAGRLPVLFCLMYESIRLKLTPAQKKVYSSEFQARLNELQSPGAAAALVALALLQRHADEPYHGQKTHEKKIVTAIGKLPPGSIPENVLESLVESLPEFGANRLVEQLLAEGERRFPENPAFLLAHVKFLLGKGHSHPFDINNRLTKARKLIDAIPRGERQQRLLEDIQPLESAAKHMSMGGFFGTFMDFFGRMGGFEDDYEDDFDDEY